MGASDNPLLVLTGNERGFIRPCGCSKPAHGGIHRRAEALDALRGKFPGLGVVSSGSLVVEGGRQQQLKFEAYLLAMGLMGYAALGLGPGEFLLGIDYLIESQKGLAPFPYLAANVARGEEKPFATHVRLPESAIVVTSLVSEKLEIAGASVRPIVDSLATMAPHLQPGDNLLLLWNGEESEVASVAAAVPESLRTRTIIAFGGSSDLPRSLPAVESVRIVAIGSKGRDLALLRPKSSTLLESQRLDESMRGSDDANAILEQYRGAVRDEALAANWPRRDAASVFVGESACLECHKEACDFLDSSGHERAFATLEATNDQYDPECIRCHVVGFEEKGGFVSKAATPQLINVQCEACHGPGEAHVMTQAKTPNGKLGADFCVRCHDPDNSPKFDFKTYWPKIKHH